MPIITAQGKTFECAVGENLRQVLLQQGVEVHNGKAKLINCRGLGTCGTCAVHIEGAIAAPSWREQARLSLPPHNPQQSRRLCCQLQVLGDLQITKYDGFWGQGEQVIW
ncbi:MAG: 2Fe-2S iron-sulfur cluster-binding protein [Leptolyngbyaceae cyanobacterium bins.349]|nr:2Fe-2S iron-sulfur cluster-binding protein [Leptolyngbyaceae cyanobacterium bins.349]